MEEFAYTWTHPKTSRLSSADSNLYHIQHVLESLVDLANAEWTTAVPFYGRNAIYDGHEFVRHLRAPADLPLIIALVILAAFTYSSGLRAPASRSSRIF
jgi:hypothetical protein